MTINEAITTYVRENARASEARKAAEAAKKIILAHAGNANEIATDDWTVYIKRTPSTRLDTARLYEDFPDIKETYGKTTTSASLDPHARTAETTRTA